jgi:rubrerythrin
VKGDPAGNRGQMDKRKILDLALDVETLAEKIYLELSELFPEAKSLFERLMYEESRHAVIMTINIGFLAFDALPPEFAIDMTPLIEKTLAAGRMLEKKIEQKDITLAEALELTISMEETGAEAYFQKILRGKSTDSGLNYVKRFYQDSMHHAELIRSFKNSIEMNRVCLQPLLEDSFSKVNCWEFKKCGRQPGGIHERDSGSCPVTWEKSLDGVHDGIAAGRACWVVAGTLCRGKVQGSFAQEIMQCEACDFYKRIHHEECSSFLTPAELLSKIKE